jgi:hypothetical protein
MENQVLHQVKSYDFPTEIITLPSKGKLYPPSNPLSKGTVEMRYMTAKHEDILTNESYIKSGVVIDKLLEALVVSPIDLDDVLIGDKNALLVAARVLGYGKEYTFKFQPTLSNEPEEVTIDLALLGDKELDEQLINEGQNRFTFTTPLSKKLIEFKLLTQGDEKKIDAEVKSHKKLYKNSSPEASIRLKHTIISVDGNSDPKVIRDFVDNQLLAREARELRQYINKVSPDVNLTFTYEGDGYTEEGVSIPLGISFFWPDART